MFEEIRADKNFNLETLTYKEIFEGLRTAVAEAISEYLNHEVDSEDLSLYVERCSTRKSFGGDKNLYPKIYLDLKGRIGLLITPFEIEMMVVSNKIEMISPICLREAFYNFMCEKFPDANYPRIYDKYLINSEKIKKQREKHLFL